MIRAMQNLFGLTVARRARNRGMLGRLFGVGLTRRVARRGGFTGTIARARLGTMAARVGIGVGAVAAGIYGARFLMRRANSSRQISGSTMQTPMQSEVKNREEATLG